MVNSVDVHTVGVAGGSMIRVHDTRSCMWDLDLAILQLPYVAFTSPEDLGEVSIELCSPMSGDQVIMWLAGRCWWQEIPLTYDFCTANALGVIVERLYLWSSESCKRAFEALGKRPQINGGSRKGCA